MTDETQNETTEQTDEATTEAEVEQAPPAAEQPVGDEAPAEPEAEQPAGEEASAEPEAEAEPAADAPAEPEAEPAAEEAPRAEAAEPPPEPEPKRKRKRVPRPQRRQRPKARREQSAERKPIVRQPKPERERGRTQERRGVVVSSAMDKTIVVQVELLKVHPRYKKVIRRANKLHAHDERNEANVGDVVRVVETRPLSKTKRWRLAEVVEAAK
jgi:small subunit ribosomal protein S17